MKPDRDEYRAQFSICQWCSDKQASELHEISRGAGRGSSLGVRAAWLHLCHDCHEEMGRLSVPAQLAIKAISDPEGYDRVAVNRLRGRADDSISEQDVERWLFRFDIGQIANRRASRRTPAGESMSVG